MPGILDLMNHVQQQGELGKAEGQRKTLAGLMQAAYTAPRDQRQGFVAQMMGVSPQAGFDAQKHFDGMDDNAMEALGRYAATFDALPDDQKASAYPQLAQQARSLGLPVPMEWNPSYAPHIQKMAAAWGNRQQQGIPAQQQYAQWLLSQVPEADRDQALGVLAGTRARPATGGFGFELVPGADGRERMGRKNPRTGAFEIYDETTGDFVPMGGMGALNGAPQPSMMGGGDPFAFLDGLSGVTVTSGFRTPEHNARVNGVPNSYHLTGQARDILPPTNPQQAAMIRQQAAANGLEIIDEGDHWHLEPRPGMARGNPGLGVSRRPEDEAAAKATAEEQVKLGFLPQRGQIEAGNAGLKAQAEAQAKADVERAVAQGKKALDAGNTLDVLDSAEVLLKKASGGAVQAGRDRALGAFNISTEGAQATAGLKLLAAKLIANVPRFEGPQSNIDVQFYREAAGDLANDMLPTETRLAALQTMRQLNMKYAGSVSGGDAPTGGAGGGWSIKVKP